MGIKQYNPTTGQWENYYEELVNETVGRIYVNNRWKIAWKGMHAHNGILFTPWTDTTSLPSTAGNYVLMDDVTLSSTWTAPSGTTNICLNGHHLTISTNNTRVINVKQNAILNIYDCNHSKSTHIIKAYKRNNGSYSLGDVTISGGCIGGRSNSTTYGGIEIANNGVLNLYGGTIAGNNNSLAGAGVYSNTGTGSFNMYGGIVEFNYIGSEYGGAGMRFNSGTFNMYGGIIRNNYAGFGGGISVSNEGFINIYDGEISNNYSYSSQVQRGGGGLNMGTGMLETVTIYGGIIKNNGADRVYGGGIAQCSGTLNILGGKIENNTAYLGGAGVASCAFGNVHQGKQDITLLLNGVEVSENSSSNLSCKGAGVLIRKFKEEAGARNVSLNIKGKNIITGNTISSIDNNLYIASTVNVIGAIEEGTDVGITMETPGTFTSGYSTYNTESPDTFFSSDNANYEVTLDSGEAKLVSV